MRKHLEQNIEYVKKCVQENHTYWQISANFKREFSEANRGFSKKNIRLFCLNNDMKKLENFQVGNINQQSVSEVLYNMNNYQHEPFVNMQSRSQTAHRRFAVPDYTQNPAQFGNG